MEMIRDIGNTHVEIILGNRLWGSAGNSAEGKTFIANILSTQSDICVITYNENFNSDDIISILSKQNYSFVFLDRADLYYDKRINKVVKQLIERCPVFIDFKCWDNFYDIAPSFANIYFKENEVKIIETNDVRRC